MEDRLCHVCDQNAVENEINFLLHCTLYDDLKKRAIIVESEGRDIGFRTLTETENLTFILKHEERQCAKLYSMQCLEGNRYYTVKCLYFQLFLCFKNTLENSSADKY